MPDRWHLRRKTQILGRMAVRRLDPTNYFGMVWAWRALAQLRQDLPAVGTAAVVAPPPSRLPARARMGVEAGLRRRGATCLERCLVLQSFLLANGSAHDIVIGVSAPGEGFAAHAWLADYRPDAEAANYQELTRIPAGPRAPTR